MTEAGVGRRRLAKALGGGVAAGLALAPGLGVAARQAEADAAADHPAIVALGAVLEDAAAELGVPVGEIAVQSLVAQDWPDSCLGLAGEGEVCAEVITAGYHIVLGPPADGMSYRASGEEVIRREPAAAAETALQVRYEVTGGIDGIHEVFAVDTAHLADTEATELRRLIEEVDFWNLPAELDDHGDIVDGFWHQVTVTEGDRQHTVSILDSAGPAATRFPRFWDLLIWLNEHSQPIQADSPPATPSGTDQNRLQVHFERTGGIAGRHDEIDLDTANLSAAEASELRRLIAEADFWNLPAEIDEGVGVSDGYQYQVTVTEGGQSHAVSIYGIASLAQTEHRGFWRLVSWLEARVQSA
jgi:hypothetical protein